MIMGEMKFQPVYTTGDVKICTLVLEGETVDSLLSDFSKRIMGKMKTEQKEQFESMTKSIAGLVKDVKPRDVEFGKLLDLAGEVQKLRELCPESPEMTNDLYNTLNLCVVGLGTRLRQ